MRAMQAADIGVYDWSPATNQVTLSAQGRALLGCDPDVTLDLGGFLDLIHPDDRAAADAARRASGDEENSRLAAIVTSSDAAIVGEALDGTVTDWNRGAEAVFGYTAA